MKKITSKVLVIIAVLFVSCDKEYVIENTNEDKSRFKAPAQEVVYENVNEQVARVAAKNFISYMDERFVSAEVVGVRPIVDLNGQVNMYAVNFNPKGYVITSADVRNEPIFGFSTENNLPEVSFNKELPEGFLSLLYTTMSFNRWFREEGEISAPSLVMSNVNNWEELSTDENNTTLLRVDYIREKLKDKVHYKGRCTGYTYKKDSLINYTGVLLETKWGQYKPYNCYIPNNYPVGCVAVAMAQIMRYHKHPEHIKWNEMHNLRHVISCESMDIGDQHLAQLLTDIGIDVNMIYGANGSMAFVWDARKSFVKTYNYSHDADIEQLDFDRMVRQLRDHKLPLFYSATIPLNIVSWIPDPTAGHAFVIDGYRENVGVYTKSEHSATTCTSPVQICTSHKATFLHVNFGWYGDTDGWYNVYWKHLKNGKFEPYISWPEGYDYSRFIWCIYDIHP